VTGAQQGWAGFFVWCPANAAQPGALGTCWNAYDGDKPIACNGRENDWVTEPCSCESTHSPTVSPTASPTVSPTDAPTASPTSAPTAPSAAPTNAPTVDTCNTCHPVSGTCATACAFFEQVEVTLSFSGTVTSTDLAAFYSDLSTGFEPFYFMRVAHTGADLRPMELNIAHLFTINGISDGASLDQSAIMSYVMAWLGDVGGDLSTVSTSQVTLTLPGYLTNAPTSAPTAPTNAPTDAPTDNPTARRRLGGRRLFTPTKKPTMPTLAPTNSPTDAPTKAPTLTGATYAPSYAPTDAPSASPTSTPTIAPTAPTDAPTRAPTPYPTMSPEVTCHVTIKFNGAQAVGNAVTALEQSSVTTAGLAGLLTTALGYTVTGASSIQVSVADSDFVPTSAPTDAPTDAPTAYPTPIPTKYPTKTPTIKPTQWPTLPPTPEATNPSAPAYDAANFDFTSAPVVSSAAVLALTSFPTPSPTPPPTEAGYIVVTQKKEVTKLSVDFSFALTAAEASAMKAIIAKGIATALGIDADSGMVTITHINNQVVRRRGRRLTAATVTTAIESASENPDQVAALKTSVTTAATSGAIVDNVKQVAKDNGALVATLKAQDPKLTGVIVTETTVVKDVQVVVRAATANMPTQKPTEYATGYPSPYPTPGITLFPTSKPTPALPDRLASPYKDEKLDSGEIVAILVFSVVGFSALLARIYCWNKKVSKPPAISKSQIDDRAPVTISQVETQLDATVAAADV